MANEDKEEEVEVFNTSFKFKILIKSSTGCESKELVRYAEKGIVDRYMPYLKNLRNKCRIQIRSDLRMKEYNLEWIVNSGQLDEFGCYNDDVMKKIRLSL
jgi:hypothetical protein